MKRLLLISVLILPVLAVSARPLAVEQVPEPLKPWVDWVLKGEEQRVCPFAFNNAETRFCAWPSRLQLTLTQTGGHFAQHWQVFNESWLTLPGGPKIWPQRVQINGKPVVVLERQQRPVVKLGPGLHQIKGEFSWERLPESLHLAQQTGLVALNINGNAVSTPDLDTQGRLWLRERDTGPKDTGVEGERLDLQVFRRVIDDIPLRVVTHIDLRVSGSQREVVLGHELLAGQIPLQLVSRLPARLEADGRLRVQVRPGSWKIDLTTRQADNVTALTLPTPASENATPWPTDEVWVFDARNELRLVEVTGLTTIDPRQTNLPKAWRQLPAYQIKAGEKMQLRVVRRGDPDPEPDKLQLARMLWLDFDGGGYTLQDRVTGSMTRGWRMEVEPAIELGRVAVDGQAQFITQLPGSDKRGVEVRRGALQLEADSRYAGSIRRVPAIGWDQDFHKVNAVLNLPPGWRLLAAGGVDNVPDTWLASWTLLDLFIVLIITLTVTRLWGWQWGVLALLTLGLIWQEPFGAPRYVWLNILAAIALLRVLPVNKFSLVVRWYRNASLLALVLIVVPFMVDEIRVGLYPQLEMPAAGYGFGEQRATPASISPARAPQFEAEADYSSGALYDKLEGKVARKARAKQQLVQLDPRANVQTGPGLPQWQWRAINLGWNGPVNRDQEISLVLVNPPTNLVLSFVRVGLLALLCLLMFGVRFKVGKGFYRSAPALIFLLVPFLMVLPSAANAEFPGNELLDELKTRILEPAECLPACAQSPRLQLTVDNTRLLGRMQIHTQQAVAVPLPAGARQWWPEDVLINDKPAHGLYRSRNGQLLLALEAGTHEVVFRGRLPARSHFQLPLPLTPRQVTINAQGWTVDGVHENGVPDRQLQLTRISDAAGGKKLNALEPGSLPPFVRIERTLRLGLDWYVDTRLVRVSPPTSAVVIEVPLIDGESVLTDGVRTENGKVLINMSPRQSQLSWLSSLEKQTRLTLRAPQTTNWVETWRVDVSPVWHLLAAGLPVVHHTNPQQRWLPEWRPWPGEEVSLTVSRPEGVTGQTLTVDSSILNVAPGKRATDVELHLVLRSSQGSQHTVTLPDGADLQRVTINGAAQPIRQEGNQVTVPVVPGKQQMQLFWRQTNGMHLLLRTPQVDIGAPSVNSRVQLKLGRDRWVLLTGGPRLGPAVLIWGVLIVVALIAVGLSRIDLTPLRFWHWLLLGVGLTQIPVFLSVVIVGWLLALGARERVATEQHPAVFNLLQIGLAGLTVLAIIFLFVAVRQGLLGLPEMQIAGNNSTAYALNWFQDRSATSLPQAWVLSVPLLIYRLLMLAWALWLAFALLRWLRWGWQCFSRNGLWRHWERKKVKPSKAKRPPPAATSE